MFHLDNYQFAYAKFDRDSRVNGVYRANEIYVLEIGNDIFKHGYQIVLFRRNNIKDKRLFPS